MGDTGALIDDPIVDARRRIWAQTHRPPDVARRKLFKTLPIRALVLNTPQTEMATALLAESLLVLGKTLAREDTPCSP